MNWKFWQTDDSLRKENNELKLLLEKYDGLCKAMNQTLQFNVLEANRVINNLRVQTVSLLGGVALQHQGEILIKDDFIQMITQDNYNLKVILERNAEDNGVIVRTVEQPHPDHVPENDVEDKQ